MPIQTPAVQAVVDRVVQDGSAGKQAILAGDRLIELLIVAGSTGASKAWASDLADKLRSSQLDASAKVDLVRRHMTPAARNDLEALLDGGGLPLSPRARAILQAVCKRPLTGYANLDAAWADKVPHDVGGKPIANRPTGKAASAASAGSLLSLQLAALQGDRPVGDEMSQEIANDLLARAKELGKISGTGVEHWGTGKKELIERRALVMQLLEQNVVSLDSIKDGWLKVDQEALAYLERTDELNVDTKKHRPGDIYDVWGTLHSDVRSGRTTTKGWTDGVEKVNLDRAKLVVPQLQDGTGSFFEANPQTFSTVALGLIDDADLRARTMADLLLQFREPEFRGKKFEKFTSGASGLQAVFELRQRAAKTVAATGDAAVERDYALMRAVALANPVGSTNAVLEARHLISGIRRMSWSLVYGPKAVPAGCKVSPYSAIHHNFSTDTPKIIAAMVRETVFGGKPDTFVQLVDAMNEARAAAKSLATPPPSSAASPAVSAATQPATANGADPTPSADAPPAKHNWFKRWWDRTFHDGAAVPATAGASLPPATSSQPTAPSTPAPTPAVPLPASDLVDTPPASVTRLLAKIAERDPEVARAFGDFVGQPEQAEKPIGDRIEAFLVSRSGGRLDAPDIDDPSLSKDEKTHLRNGEARPVKGRYGEKLNLVAELYLAICGGMPNAQTLREVYFSAFGAKAELADVIFALESNASPSATLQTLTRARQALRLEFDKQPEGYRRMAVWDLDKKLELLSSSYLGEMVKEVGDLKTPEEMNDALAGMKHALELAVISGLDQIRDLHDAEAQKGPTLREAVAEIDALFTQGTATIDAYRNTMALAYEAVVKATENLGSYFDRRIPDVSEGQLVPNPAFRDDLIKEGPLHFARALAQKATAVGLMQELSPTKIVNPDGVSVLNRLGRVVFKRLLLANDMQQLKELGAGREDFCWVRTLNEKKMIAVGGVMAPFPGGYCHGAVYARGAGMAALSNAEIGGAYEQFAANCADQPIYYDDTAGKIVIMPFDQAVAEGRVRAEEAEKLRPGANRNIEYVGWDEAEKQWKTIGQHKVMVHPDRPTYDIKIYTPADTIQGKGHACLSFEEAGMLGIDGRGLGGEKNTVLAMMSVEETLEAVIPPGSYIPSSRCWDILDGAGAGEAWREVYSKDPLVGPINDTNFLQSRFYTDAQYRTNVRLEMSALVKKKVVEYLVNPDGTATEAGKKLLEEVRANPRMRDCSNWILRSSYSAEDRPYKSGAGQYDSFPNCRTDAEILVGDALSGGEVGGVAGVLASAWESPPIENNVVEEYNLMHIAPSITAMKCLNSEYSGVGISRDTDTGYRRTASYQAVVGFGGGVEHGNTEEGRLTATGNTIKKLIEGNEMSLLPEPIQRQLWQAMMDIERLFHKKVEPGKGFAVDVEWVFDKDDQKLYIVQARTVRV